MAFLDSRKVVRFLAPALALGCSSQQDPTAADSVGQPTSGAATTGPSTPSGVGGSGASVASTGAVANATGTATSSAASTSGVGEASAATTLGGATATTTTGATMGATTGATGTTGSANSVSCTFTVTQTMSDVIPTVGIVEFSVDLPTVDSATVQFGLDTNYGMSAPVDLAAANYRTLLLGMKTSREYHFRVSAISGSDQCSSEDFTLTTGDRPNGLGLDDPSIAGAGTPEQLADGYLITARWGTNNGGPAFILDKDNDLVWWFEAEDDVIRARMSYDGKAMWIRNTAQTNGTGVVQRVSMDGLSVERWDVPPTTHDLAVIPDGKLGLIAHTDGCDEVVEFNPADGSTTPLFNLEQAHGQTDCHVNYLAYSAADDSFYVSDWQNSTYVKISRTGELIWVLNGEASDFTGSNWTYQHGIHVLAPDHFLIFSNGAPGENSQALEYSIDETTMTATELWRYDAGVQANFGGDIQRLANGNTLITYSSAGIIQQLDPSGQLLQELTYPIGTTVSYAVKRGSLYGGPPPKIEAYVPAQ